MRKRFGIAVRRLGVERLESREMFSVMRIGAWNTQNHPNSIEAEADFAAVFQAIGNQTVQGNTRKLDLLSLTETDPPSALQLESIFETLYPSADYQLAISSQDGGGDSTGFIFDSTQIQLVESIELTGVLTHYSIRGQFRPVGTTGESDFFAYSMHLKSGNTTSDETQRATEAAYLRANADALGDDVNVLFMGDFNMHSSFEPAYVHMAASGAGQSHDVANALGSWTGNTAFVDLHTHATTNVRSRFDLQAVSQELHDQVGLEYVDGSFQVFGNNGSHGLGNPITSGTGASASVLAALTRASDHLPIFADFEVLVSAPGVRIVESAGNTKIVEGKQYDTYSLVLDTVPTQDVIVTIAPDGQADTGAGPGVSQQLVFTPLNAFTPQTVIVTAVDDNLLEGTHTSLISHSVASLDPEYQGVPVSAVTAVVVDDDAPVILLNELDSDGPGSDTMEFIELYDGGVGDLPLDGWTVVFFNGANNLSYARYDLDGYRTNQDGLFVLGNAAVPDVGRVFPDGSLQNGADGVALYRANASDFPQGSSVTTTGLYDALVYGSNAPAATGLLPLLLPGQLQLNEAARGAAVSDALARLPDLGTPRTTSQFAAVAPTPGQLNQPPTAGITLTQSQGRTDVAEGSTTDTYTLVLDTFPTQNVTILVQPNVQLNLGAGNGVAVALVFTPENALIPQVVHVSAVDDDQPEQAHQGIITHSVSSLDANYHGESVALVAANITDNDERTIVINEVDADTAGIDQLEFIELFDGGRGNTSLDGLVVVLFNGNGQSQYGAFDLDGLATDDDGFFVLGNASVPNVDLVFANNFLQNGPDAVALYQGDASQFLTPTTTDLLDANVYSTNNVVDTQLLALLPNGLLQWNEDGNNLGTVESVARIADGGLAFDSLRFALRTPTPGVRNVPLPAGDYDRDGSVDDDDRLVWLTNFGSTTQLHADGNQDGVVDAADFGVWRDNLGSTIQLSVAAASQPTVRPIRAASSSPTSAFRDSDSPTENPTGRIISVATTPNWDLEKRRLSRTRSANFPPALVDAAFE